MVSKRKEYLLDAGPFPGSGCGSKDDLYGRRRSRPVLVHLAPVHAVHSRCSEGWIASASASVLPSVAASYFLVQAFAVVRTAPAVDAPFADVEVPSLQPVEKGGAGPDARAR